MPTYEYQCSACDGKFESIHRINDRKAPEADACPICATMGTVKQATLTAPTLGDPVRLGFTRTDGAIKEVLQKIHEKSPGSTLNDSSTLTQI